MRYVADVSSNFQFRLPKAPGHQAKAFDKADSHLVIQPSSPESNRPTVLLLALAAPSSTMRQLMPFSLCLFYLLTSNSFTIQDGGPSRVLHRASRRDFTNRFDFFSRYSAHDLRRTMIPLLDIPTLWQCFCYISTQFLGLHGRGIQGAMPASQCCQASICTSIVDLTLTVSE